jgi:hypothetical protein
MKKSLSAFKVPLLVVVHVPAAAARVLVLASNPAGLFRLQVALAHVLGQLVIRVKGLAADAAGEKDAEFFQRAMIK